MEAIEVLMTCLFRIAQRFWLFVCFYANVKGVVLLTFSSVCLSFVHSKATTDFLCVDSVSHCDAESAYQLQKIPCRVMSSSIYRILSSASKR